MAFEEDHGAVIDVVASTISPPHDNGSAADSVVAPPSDWRNHHMFHPAGYPSYFPLFPPWYNPSHPQYPPYQYPVLPPPPFVHRKMAVKVEPVETIVTMVLQSEQSLPINTCRGKRLPQKNLWPRNRDVPRPTTTSPMISMKFWVIENLPMGSMNLSSCGPPKKSLGLDWINSSASKFPWSIWSRQHEKNTTPMTTIANVDVAR